MGAGNAIVTLVEAPDDPKLPFHFTRECYGLCRDLLHLYPKTEGEGSIRVRHGDGEAMRDFTPDEYHSWAFLEWIAAVHRYEEGR